jgi:signal transduction histidine kinase
VDVHLPAQWLRTLRTVDVGVTVLLAVALYAVGTIGITSGKFPELLLPLILLALAIRWPLLGTTSAAALSVGVASIGLTGDAVGIDLGGDEVAYAAATTVICSYLAVRTVPGWSAVAPGAVSALVGVFTGSVEVAAAAALAALVGGGAAALQGFASRTAESETLVARLRARSLEQERRQAWLAERAELARELHDIVGHLVTAIVVSAEAAKAQGADQGSFDTIAELGRKALGELDVLVGSLRDEDPAPTKPVTSRLADLSVLMEPLRSSGIATEVTTVVTSQLSASTQLAIYRIVQETTTNILKHAHATTVRVDVVESARDVTVRVSDNGQGSVDTIDAGERVGHGLVGIGERVEVLGGSWTYDSRPGEGTTVTAVLPTGGVR